MMRDVTKQLPVLLAMLLVFLADTASAQANSDNLARALDPLTAISEERLPAPEHADRGVVRMATVTLPADIFTMPPPRGDPPPTVNVPIGAGLVVELVEERRREDGDATRINGVANVAGFSRFSAVLEDGRLARLKIRIDSEVFRLTATGVTNGSIEFHLVVVDAMQIPAERAPIEPSLPSGRRDDFQSRSADDPLPVAPLDGPPPTPEPYTEVNIAVFYTFAAKVEAAGLPFFVDIEDEIDDAIQDANITFEGQLGLTLNPVYVGEVNYTEDGDIAVDLDRLTCPCDNKIDAVGSNHLNGVFTPWKSNAADIVSLWVRDLDEAGIANIMSGRTMDFAPRAASVVDWVAATANYSFEHEIGHNFGARHDRFKDNSEGYPDAFNHGYINMLTATTGRTTLMGYPTVCPVLGASCFRLPIWSDPFFPVAGDWGVMPPSNISAHNKRTLQLSLPFIKDFETMHSTWLGCCVNVGTFFKKEWRPGPCP